MAGPGHRSIDWQAVAVVHQEPQLFPNLTVAENVLVGRERTAAGNIHGWAQPTRR